MKDVKNRIYGECRELIESYDLPTNHLRGALDEHYNNKSWINQTLGLSEDNNYRIVLPLANTMETRPDAMELIKEIEEISEGEYQTLDLQFMWRGKNKVRVTKVISAMWDRLMSYSLSRWNNDSYTTNFSNMLHKASELFVESPEIAKLPKDAIIHKFHVWYGDYVKNGRVAVISTNPWDFFTASCRRHDYCGFTSCVCPDGEYANTILDYLASDCVAMMYIAKENRINFKEGRCWIYLNETRVFQGRIFGSIFDSDMLLVRDYVQQKIAPDEVLPLFPNIKAPSKWIKRTDDIALNSRDYIRHGTAYIDEGYGIMSQLKGISEHKIFEFNEGICLKCGDGLDGNESEYLCSYCADKKKRLCCSCSRIIYDDDETYVIDSGNVYCEDCWHENFNTCERCHDHVHVDYSIILDDGLIVCDGCFDRCGWECCECGKKFVTSSRYYSGDDPVVDLDGYKYCEKCAEEYTDYCYICNRHTKTSSMLRTDDNNSVLLCSYCYDNETYVSRFAKYYRFINEEERDEYDEKKIAAIVCRTDREIIWEDCMPCAV